MIEHDLRCTGCKRKYKRVVMESGVYPKCKCGAPTTWIPDKLNYYGFGSQIYSDAAGRTFSSQNEKEKWMGKKKFYTKGGKVHGARPDLSFKNSAISYKGQTSHISTGERSAARGGSR